MPPHEDKSRLVYGNLDTAYVNLSALIRYLREHEFTGHVHVELDEYEADVFLQAQTPPQAHERNRASGREEEGEAAFHRLLVRAREAGGLISVYEEETEATGANINLKSKLVAEAIAAETLAHESNGAAPAVEDEAEWPELLGLSGELIAAVERATRMAGGDFASAFQRVRISLADDYPFLDPAQRTFAYTDGEVSMQTRISARTYLSGVSEVLRGVVESIAIKGERNGMRRAVAGELAKLSPPRQTTLARFKLTPHLERIAGMKPR